MHVHLCQSTSDSSVPVTYLSQLQIEMALEIAYVAFLFLASNMVPGVSLVCAIFEIK